VAEHDEKGFRRIRTGGRSLPRSRRYDIREARFGPERWEEANPSFPYVVVTVAEPEFTRDDRVAEIPFREEYREYRDRAASGELQGLMEKGLFLPECRAHLRESPVPETL